ncbi:hypothetical protein [Prosthecobacter sp.]|uniref:hypothetical protein n=1 Tax=Prosthecobacter sp. TaxID=1965333 RepID=UPI00378435E4
MSNAYTVLWNSDRVRIAKKHGLIGRSIDFLFGGPHTTQPSFIKAGVKAGETVYPVSVRDGALHILSQVRIRAIMTVDDFIAAHPDLYPPETHAPRAFETLAKGVELHPWLRALNWTGSDHVLLAERSTPFSLDTVLPPELLTRLTFRFNKADWPVSGVAEGRLTTTVGLQGIHRLSFSSAWDFASLFPA